MISNHKIECGVLTTRCQVPVKTFDIPYLETRIAPGTSSRNCRRRPKKKAPPGTWSTTATRWCHNLRNCSKKMSYLEKNLCREHGDTSKTNELCMMFSTPVFQTHFKTLDCCLCFFLVAAYFADFSCSFWQWFVWQWRLIWISCESMEGLVQKTFLQATPLHVGQAKLFHRFTWSTLGRASQKFKAITQPITTY